MSSKELKIVIKADGSIAVSEIKKLDAEVEKLGKESKDAGSKMNKTEKAIDSIGRSAKKSSKEVKVFENSWASLATGVNQALDIMSKGKQMISEGWEFAKQGAKLSEARDSFDMYARSVGKSSSEILSKLKAASGGTISQMGLIITASEAMSLGVTKDADKMANLLEIARNKARLFGVETSKAFEDIVTGIGRGSPLILDNLGIKMPAGFQKMTQGMSAADKTAKLLELTLKSGNEQLKEMGGLTDNNADSFRELESSWDDLKSSGGELLSMVFMPLNRVLATTLGLINGLIHKFNAIYSAAMKFGAGGPFDGVSTDKLLKSYNQYKKEYAKNLSIVEQASSPANSYRRSGTILNDAQIMAAKQSLNYAKQNMNAVEKELNRRSQVLIKSAKTTAKEIQDSVKKIWDSFIPGFGGSTKSLNGVSRHFSSSPDIFSGFSDGLKDITDTLVNVDDDLGSFYDDIDTGIDKFIQATEESNKLKKAWEDLSSSTSAVFTGFDIVKAQKALTPEKFLSGALNFFPSGYGFADILSKPKTDLNKSDKDNLSNIIADAITEGFNRADFSNFTKTLGNILSSILSRSVSSRFPTVSAGGAVNWGNLGVNMAVSAGLNWLKSPGRPFGGYVEHGKERIQQAADLKTNLTSEYLKTFKTELLPYLSQAVRYGILGSRNSINGVSVGYRKHTSGDRWHSGIFAKNTHTYELIDNGASASLAELKKWNEAGEKYNKQQEHINSLLDARGFTYEALKKKAEAYNTTVETMWSKMDEQTLKWSDGYKQAIDLTDDKFNLYSMNAQLKRQLGAATASRISFANQAFTSYAPFLNSVPIDRSGLSPLGGSLIPGYQPMQSTAGMTTSQIYDALYKNSMNFQDRQASSFTLDMVKNAGSGKFELSKLKLTNSEAYAKKYGEFLSKQIDSYAEVMKREESIYNDLTKTFEERSSALQEYEAASDAYYQSKLNKLAEDKRKEDEIKQKQEERTNDLLGTLMTRIGEVSEDSLGRQILVLSPGQPKGKQLVTQIKNSVSGENPELAKTLTDFINAVDAPRWN